MSPTLRPSFLSRVYTQNPFYVISAVLMLFGVRSAYGELEIGSINTWAMTGVLVGYTTVLATIGVLIVRWGRVWEDARSILLLLVVLFLAVSVGTDDLFVRSPSFESGTAIMLGGFLFAALLSEAVLWGTGIRFGLGLRIPYHLLLALFFVAPWWFTPEWNPRPRDEQSWMLLGFPTLAAGLFLLLLPIVRRGPRAVANNGTPWSWPWFPWTVFGVFAGAVCFRSYVLCMTYGLTGPIWRDTGSGRAIVFDTIWGPYFLLPLAGVLFVLLLESRLARGDRRAATRLLARAPLLLALAAPLPFADGEVFRNFRGIVTETIGSPAWLALWLMIGCYGWSALRRVPEAGFGVIGGLALLSIIGPNTVDVATLLDPRPEPVAFVGVCLMIRGLWRRSSVITAGSVVPLSMALAMWLPETPAAAYRFEMVFHLAWLSLVAIGFGFRDGFARALRIAGACVAFTVGLLVLRNPPQLDLPTVWQATYLTGLATMCLLIAQVWRHGWYMVAGGTVIVGTAYGSVALAFRAAVNAFGWRTVTALMWSVGTLLIGFLISAHKANWLPRRSLMASPRADEPEDDLVG